MNHDDFHQALAALSRSTELRAVAKKSGFGTESEDVVQDVLETLARMEPAQYARIEHLPSFAAKMVRNEAIWRAAKKRRAAQSSTVSDDELTQVPQHLFKDPSEAYELAQYSQYLRTALDRLDANEQEITRAFHLDGESGPSIAQRTQRTKDVVRGLRERSLEKLKKFFAELPGHSGKGN